MTEYKIAITRPAELDLAGIYAYIADTLKEPMTAMRLYTTIKNEIMTLSALPERHPIVDEQPYAEIGVRKLFVENYVVFYVIDKERRVVSVIRILFNRREWRHILGYI